MSKNIQKKIFDKNFCFYIHVFLGIYNILPSPLPPPNRLNTKLNIIVHNYVTNWSVNFGYASFIQYTKIYFVTLKFVHKVNH